MKVRKLLRGGVLVALVVVLNLPRAAGAVPLLEEPYDLVLLEIDWTPAAPGVDDVVHFSVEVGNDGTADTATWDSVSVHLFIDEFLIEDAGIDNIPPGGTEWVDFYWIATAGDHTVRAVVDYGDYFPESDEFNNEMEELLEVDCPAPAAPALSSPSDGSDSCEEAPSFDWSPVDGATSYRIQVDEDSGFGAPEIDRSTSRTSYTLTDVLTDGTYYWRVRASNDCGEGPWSAIWRFTVLSPPAVPALYEPADGSSTSDATPYFDWSRESGASSYRIQVDEDPGFGAPEIDRNTSRTSYTPADALADSTYCWRVRASNACGTSAWADAWQFTVHTPISAPSDLEATAISEAEIGLSWQDNSADEMDFHVERSLDGSAGWVEIGTVETDVTTYSDTELSCGTTYHYRVRAHRHSDGTYSGYSNVDQATTWECTASRPDLTVTGIVGQPEGEGAGVPWRFDASVENVGEGTYGGGATYRGCVDGVECEERPLRGMAPGEGTGADWVWEGGALGEHIVCVAVDPWGEVEEEDEGNNEVCQSFRVVEKYWVYLPCVVREWRP